MMAEITWSAFHFLRPQLLWLLLPAAVLLYFWLNNTSKQDGWQQSCDPELLAAMQVQNASKGTRWTWLYWPITLITILALAGPAIRQMPVPMVKNQSALIIALDVSKSMLSDDLKPSRLQRAKFKIQDLLDQRKDGQTALIVYSGDAFVVTPLTDDTDTIKSLLDVLDPSIMPVTGTNTSAALDKAAELLQQAGITRGQILLVTDSIDMYKTEDTIKQVADQGTTIHVIAVGTAEGAPIPTNQGFLKDLRGQIVVPKVDFKQLQDAARMGQGRFNVLSNNNQQDDLYELNPQNDENNKDELGGENFIDDGPLLALLIVPMLALLYRRGILMVLCLGFMLNTQPSYAFEWNDLWLNKDQQAYRQIETDPAQAFQKAKNQKLKAAAAYKKQDFKTAQNLFTDEGQSLEEHYNRGNALAQSGELQAAIESYEKALTYNPDDEDTLYNKKLVEEALQQQQNQQNQQNQNDQENQENQDSEQNQQDQQNQQQNQESSEQEKREQQQQAEKDQQAEGDEQQEQEQEQEQQQQQQQQEGEQQEQQEIELTPEEKALDAEEKQAMEQWLRRIKDDPGGLMRRKFLYQYHRRNQDGETYDQQTTEDW